MFPTVKQIISELLSKIPNELHNPLIDIGGDIKGDCVSLFAHWGDDNESRFVFDLGDPNGFSKAGEWLEEVLLELFV